jgi:hypothetical protein
MNSTRMVLALLLVAAAANAAPPAHAPSDDDDILTVPAHAPLPKVDLGPQEPPPPLGPPSHLRPQPAPPPPPPPVDAVAPLVFDNRPNNTDDVLAGSGCLARRVAAHPAVPVTSAPSTPGAVALPALVLIEPVAARAHASIERLPIDALGAFRQSLDDETLVLHRGSKTLVVIVHGTCKLQRPSALTEGTQMKSVGCGMTGQVINPVDCSVVTIVNWSTSVLGINMESAIASLSNGKRLNLVDVDGGWARKVLVALQ